MSEAELGERARALIEAPRGAFEPAAANRARVRWRVERALAATERASDAPRWRRPLVALLAAAGVLGAAGGAAALAWSARRAGTSAQAPPPETAATAPLTARAAPARPANEPSPPAIVAAPSSPAPPATTRAAARRAPGELAAETALIASAQAATNRGQAGRALELLDQYERRFGGGALAEEHAAARVLALCSAGRRAAARAEAAQFLARWPRSPQAARVRQACSREATTP